ncbi:SUKH-4 family immunity protein [Streptomyces sp. NPDC005492]|uniref:SUKH-4 family immunity protein n=1 Tax=Streptomyces sp. NPDC005492 TaxID=3156883 RepID=UPI0033A07D41
MVETIRWDEDRAQAVTNSEVRSYLMNQGLPVETLLFEADLAGAEPFVTNSGQSLILIGAFDEDFHFFVDIDTGSVFFGLDSDENPVFSNEGLGSFSACILRVQERYPFYYFDDTLEVKRQAGQALADSIRRIDPVCLDFPDGFWPSFIHDVSIGDYYEGSL